MRTFLIVKSSLEQNQIALNKIKNKKQIALFACDIARSVLHVWTKQFPDDLTVPNLLQTTEDYLFDLTDFEQLRIARNNTSNAAYYAYYAASAASNAAYYAVYYAYYAASAAYNAAYNAVYNVAYNAAYNAVYYASNAAYYAAYASNNKEDQWNFIYKLYLKCFKPNHIIIPKNPLFLEIANEIKSTRNFKLYNVLTDAILDYSNIKINTKCLGLSNWLLFHLLTKD